VVDHVAFRLSRSKRKVVFGHVIPEYPTLRLKLRVARALVPIPAATTPRGDVIAARSDTVVTQCYYSSENFLMEVGILSFARPKSSTSGNISGFANYTVLRSMEGDKMHIEEMNPRVDWTEIYLIESALPIYCPNLYAHTVYATA